MENMDYMDIDEVCDFPDTPDRLAAHMINGKGCIEIESESSVASHLGNNDSFGKEAINKLRGRSKLVLGNGDSRKLSFQSRKYPGVSNKSEGDGNFPISLDNSPFSNHENRYSLYSQHIEKGKALYSSQSPTCGENILEDLTEQSGPAQVGQNPFPSGVLDDRQTNEIRKGPISTNGFSFLRGISNSSTTTNNACKGKGKIDDTCKGGSGLDCEKGAFGDSQPKARKVMSSSFYSLPSPRVGGQKRLVRNGFISPHRIAKANQLAENRCNGPTDVQHDKETLVSDCPLSPIKDLIAEDNSFLEGQKMVTHTSSSKEPGTRTIDLATRSSITHNEEASGDTFRCFEGLGGWRSTRTRSKKITLPLADEGLHLSRTKDDPCFVNQKNANKVVRRDNGNVSSSSVGSKTASASILIKRQKQGSASSSYGESSTSASAGSDIMFLSPSGELLKSRSTRNQSGHGPTVLDPVIEIDEFSPEARHIGSHNIGSSSNADSDAMARQIQADEMLARELQEQLYNEAPGPEDNEIDAHTESAVQQEEISQNAHSSGSHPIFHPRGSLISSFYRRLQSRPPQNPSIHGGTNARGPSSRLTRLRSRIPSQLPRLTFRESSSLFPPNMDLDMRIHILEALEAFSEMGMAGNFLEAEREFNENDYEMLLVLDENNHQHGGASLDQINSLPQLKVQGDNFEEACAICLETPTSGDTIRHLPCLHKFHKDCIDPWLRRRTSCPICKSSIT